MNNFLKYIFSLHFAKSLVFAITSVIFLLFIVMMYIRIYTHHGRSFATPDFIGLSIDEAEKVIKEKSLRYIIFDSVYNSEYPAGAIIDQHPKAEFLVKKNRKVFFTINASGPELVSIPELEGETFRDANAKLTAIGLQLGALKYKYDITKNVVLELKFQNETLEKGTKVPKGSRIDLVLSKGLGDATSMIPDLHGYSVEKAQETAGKYSFSIASIIPDTDLNLDELPDSITPMVWRQRPESDKEIKKPLGSHIDIWVTIDSVKVFPELAKDSVVDSLSVVIDEMLGDDKVVN